MYQSIHKLPLHKFIDCIVDNNLHSLVISGKPAEQQLQDTWNGILSEYSEAIGNHEYKLYIGLYKEITILKLTYDQINNAVSLLQVTYSEYLCKQLNKLLKTDFRLNWKDQASYQEQLLKCIRRSKAIKIQLDLKIMQFEAIQKKHESKGEPRGREYFVSVLISLSDHAKYPIHDTITVGEYCERLKRFNAYLETLKSSKR